MRIAVGPEGSDDVRFVERAGRTVAGREGADPTAAGGKARAGDVQDIRGKPEFDLAVVRGNMKLSTDWPVVAILRQDVVALMVPPRRAAPAPRKAKGAKAASRKPPKIEKVSDLAGKRVGIVDGTDGGPELLDLILKSLRRSDRQGDGRSSSPAAISRLPSTTTRSTRCWWPVRRPARSSRTPCSRPRTARKVRPSSPSTRPKASASARRPTNPSTSPAGAFGGVPPMPTDELTTLSYPLYLVARKNFNEDKIATFSKLLYALAPGARLRAARRRSRSSHRRPTKMPRSWCIRAPPIISATIQSRSSTNTATRSSTAC